MFDRRLVVNFDWVLLLTVMTLAGIGIVNLYSATASWNAATPIYMKQLLWLGGGVMIALAICLFDYRHLEHFAVHSYVVSVALLVFVLTMGKTTMGATRWIDLGFFNLQPSEVIKIATILVLARIFSATVNPFGFSLVELWRPALLILVPAVLILKQPDLGTTIMVMAIAGTMLLFAGLKRGTMVFLALLGLVVVIAGWFGLRDYQRARVMTFLNPEADPLGSGYHIIQSKIAVGSGGFWGRDFFRGLNLSCPFCRKGIPILLFRFLLKNGDSSAV